MAAPTLTYTLTNGTTADASQVMQDLNDLLNGYTDGTKDLTINALTANGAAAFNGHVTLGNGSVDDLTFSGSIASTLTPKTDGAYDLGTAALGFRAMYLGDGGGDTVKVAVPALAADYTLTLPTTDGNAGEVMRSDGSGTLSWVPKVNYSLAGTVGSSALTIALKDAAGADASATSPIDIQFRNVTSATGTLINRSVSAALSTVVSSGSTAGFTSATTNYLYIYALDNAGTVELAWSSSRIFDENTVQTSTAEGAAGAADDRYTLYSTTARSNVPVRLLGRMKFSLTTAGTWDEVPDEVSCARAKEEVDRSEIVLTTANGHGSSSTYIRRFTTTELSVGSAMSYPGDSSTLGVEITIAKDGVYSIVYIDVYTGGIAILGISLNSAELTTGITNIVASTRIAAAANDDGSTSLVATTRRLKVGDVIRPHTNSTVNATTLAKFSITRIGD